MKKVIIALALSTLATAAFAADTYVEGYVRKDGTYVAPHYRTAPNDTRTDNYSSRPNVNPYNGREGTRDPYAQQPSDLYGQPRQRKNNGF